MGLFDGRTNSRRHVVVLVLALGQVLSPVLSTALGGGQFTTADRAGEPPIVPSGYAFSIWGLVEVLSVVYAIWVFFAPEAARPLLDRLAYPLAVVFAGFSLWIVASDIEPVWTTLAVFLVMVAALLRALTIALSDREGIRTWPTPGRVILWALLGIYTGWSSIAIWLNLTTALTESGAPIAGAAGIGGQLAILAGATATAVFLLRWSAGLLSYAAAVVWAFAGVVSGASAAGETVLALAAGAGLVITLGATLVFKQPAFSGRLRPAGHR
ncbi:hypothetical protein [Amycolatopsis sp. 195334CR]|uniref:hypothetical protein n=1 Tax=Amycolatopsis sp. 195334CR TaxID=2814588 RepID=UPI001A8F529B|nr:hypothetical protein [Amycolatopsis sp. 195334CR]MBN6040334.1 hypothetical protein [Amycolatopsis sp. 195334CR]